MTVKQASEQGAYGNSRLLFRLQIYRYDKDNGSAKTIKRNRIDTGAVVYCVYAIL